MGHRIPDRVIEDIRFNNDIVEVIGSYITLKRAGSAFKACCPFHNEKTPSFTVNPSRQSFKCFGCGEGGNVFTFLMKHQGVDFITAVKMLAEKAGIELEVEEDRGGGQRKMIYEINQGISEFFQRCLRHDGIGKMARQYLQERDLWDEDLLQRFQIGFAPDSWDAAMRWGAKHSFAVDLLELAGLVVRTSKPSSRSTHYDRFRNRLMFPVHDSQGRVVGFSGRILEKEAKAAKYVNSPETPVFHKGRLLYAMDKARRSIVSSKDREAIICEGQIDVVRCHQAGFEMAVAAQGTAFTADHVRILKRYADGVVLAFDSDEAGQNAAVKTAAIFMDAGLVVRVAVMPPGEDPDSTIRSGGVNAFQSLLDEALSVVDFQVGMLSGREDRADSVSAVDRIARSVLATISHSPNSVQRARLLQDAARCLNLPEKALEEDLAKVEKEREKRAASRPVVEEPPFVEEEDLGPDESDLAFLGEVVRSGATDAPVQREELMPRQEQELCEHLIHVADFPELGDLVRRLLPMDLLQSKQATALLSVSLQALEEGRDVYDVLAEDSELKAHAERIEKAPNKAAGRDSSRSHAVQDIISRLWRHHLEEERKALRGNEASTERRVELTVAINTLRDGASDWAVKEMLIEGEIEFGRPD